MSSRSAHIDRFFLISVCILTLSGFVIFLSASLGLLAQSGASFGSVAAKQALSLLLGVGVFYFFSRLKYTWLKKSALFIFLAAVGVNLLLFIPALALHVNGASRWIGLGPLTFQPSELLKVAFIIYLAAWIQYARDRIKTLKFGLLPYIVIMTILSVLLLSQSDTDTLVIIGATGIIMLLVAGLPVRHVLLGVCAMALVVGGVIYFRPYAAARVKTFFNPTADTQGAGYQINQSLIAVGSGRIFGRGFGQSIQKFGYLPQPTDDSIFAVAAEEFGFIGGLALIGLYVLLAISIFRVGTRATDPFGALLAIGIGVLILTESFLNIAAMLGLVPLSGVPLLFVSHGGTALIITLGAAGIVANVSKHQK